MSGIIQQLHSSMFLGRIFHTLDYELCRELKDCETVLDLGCGPSSPIKHCKNIKHSVGVEPFKPYLEQSKKSNIHSEYLNKTIQEVDIKNSRFDAVILIEVLEHLNKKDGQIIIEKASKWAKKKVIITTPNGFIPQNSVDENPLQKHLSGWSGDDMQKLGFNCHGLGGLRMLRDNSEKETMNDGDLTASIKYSPKILWFIVATISQAITWYQSKYAFELLCVKSLPKK